ncbi:MAG: type II toxin-antitoxin system VapC family toxin [Acidobacteriota bacterium]
MVLVDTSVWIDHLRQGNQRLADLLIAGRVVCHPFVIGEVACGSLRNRAGILGLLAALPSAPMATHEEVLGLLASERLYSRGLGWVDVHLLASARLLACTLWTLDKTLAAVGAAAPATNPEDTIEQSET